jgi:hypothetical protein
MENSAATKKALMPISKKTAISREATALRGNVSGMTRLRYGEGRDIGDEQGPQKQQFSY